MIDITNHKKVALELSGGKDSVACLYLFREYLPIITVYWLNTGDNYPETLDVIATCREMCPNFVEVKSDVRTWINRHGLPSEVVSVTGAQLHQPLKEDEVVTVESQYCCAVNIMAPLHNKVLEDGNTCIIRGQKAADTHKGMLVSGDWFGGVQFIYPVQDWTDAQVMAYLKDVGAPIHPVYSYSDHGADCMRCTGWWEKTPMGLLANHKGAYNYVISMRDIIKHMALRRLDKC